jgi:hypothetical protein
MRAPLKLRKLLPALLALVAFTAGCRLDMHLQPYYRPLAKSDFFNDDRSARLPSKVQWRAAICAMTLIFTPAKSETRWEITCPSR